jgi:hypothetical protein
MRWFKDMFTMIKDLRAEAPRVGRWGFALNMPMWSPRHSTVLDTCWISPAGDTLELPGSYPVFVIQDESR